MYKKLIAILSPFLILTTSSFMPAIIPPSLPSYVVSSDIYGPYDGSEGLVPISLSITYNGSGTKDIYEEMIYSDVIGIISSTSNTYSSISSLSDISTTINFNASLFLDYDYLVVKFNIRDASSIVLTRNFTIYRKIEESINVEKYATYNSRPTTFTFSNAGVILSEKYDFTNTSSYFANDEYYEFDLSNQIITYTYSEKFKYKRAILQIPSIYKKYFPYFLSTSEEYIDITLKITQKSNKLTISFPTYRFDENTLTYSMFLTTTTINSTHFFLPLKYKDELDGMKTILRIDGAGRNEISITHEITFVAGDNVFGDCDTSTYCISGEQA